MFREKGKKSKDNLIGCNVTIPYKQAVIPFLDNLNSVAKEIGAVNTIKVAKDKSLQGFKTDAIGFENSLKPMLKSYHTKALILGTGGASKAVAYVLTKNKIDFTFVSRSPAKNQITYKIIKIK